jgi:hypothetical protein
LPVVRISLVIDLQYVQEFGERHGLFRGPAAVDCDEI